MKRKIWRNSLPKAPKLVISAFDNPGAKVLKEGKAIARIVLHLHSPRLRMSPSLEILFAGRFC